jgi:hypothetical protein
MADDPAQCHDPKGDPQGSDADDHERFPEPKPGEWERARDGQQIATRDEREPSNRGVRESCPDLPKWPMEQATGEADEDPRNEGEPHRPYPDRAHQLGLLKHVVASVDRGCRPRQSPATLDELPTMRTSCGAVGLWGNRYAVSSAAH